tara:strand:- start:679 stop:1065 length:387 start_codon:yes stop_codon:yes gene_type:complete
MIKKEVKTNNSPEAIGPYSQAISCNDFLFISGQIPIDLNTGKIISDDFEKQALQCLENIKGILDEKKLNLNSILKLTVFLTDLNNFDLLNKVFEIFFSKTTFPARAAVQVSRLPKDAKVEIDAICFEK